MNFLVNKLIFTLLISLFAKGSYSQAPTIEWQRSYGGTGDDDPYLVKQTTDGGYVTVGGTTSNDGDVSGNNGDHDYWVVKSDALGNVQWQKCYGGSGHDFATAIDQTTDGGYIIVGSADSTGSNGGHGMVDIWAVKINTAGVVQWQKCYGGTKSDGAYSVEQTSEGGYIIAGSSNSHDGDVIGNHSFGSTYDMWVLKIDTIGMIQWQKCLGGLNTDAASEVKQTSDNGYIIAGYTMSTAGDVTVSYGGGDYWVVKLDSAGTLEWQKSLGGTSTERAESIQQTTDGGYIVAGYSSSNDNDVSANHQVPPNFSSDYWIVKLSSSGSIQWKNCYGGAGYEQASSIKLTDDGGYIIAGTGSSNDGDVSGNHGDVDYWILYLNETGIIQWQKSLGGSGCDGCFSNERIEQTTDGGFIISGSSNSTDGDVSGNHGGRDYWVVKLENPSWISELLNEDDFLIYPNPANTKINIEFENLTGTVELKIIDLVGKTVMVKNINERSSVCDIIELQNGIYFIQINTAKGYITKKFIKN